MMLAEMRLPKPLVRPHSHQRRMMKISKIDLAFVYAGVTSVLVFYIFHEMHKSGVKSEFFSYLCLLLVY